MSYGLYNNEYAQIGNQYTWMNAGAPGPWYPTDGLVDYWSFDDTLAGVNGNTWTADDSFAYSYETIGSGKCINQTNKGRLYIAEAMFPGFEANTTAWSIAYWAYIGGTSLGGHTGFGKGNAHTQPAGVYGWTLYTTTKLRLGNFGCDKDTTGLSLASQWYHVIITLNRTDAANGEWKIYVNNVIKNTFTGCLPNSNATDFQLFRLWQSQYMDNGGKYDDFLMYSKVLSEAERTQIYEHTR